MKLGTHFSKISGTLKAVLRGKFMALSAHIKEQKGWVWWRMLVIPVLWEAETRGSRFAASLSSLSLFSLSLSLSLST